MGGVGNATLPAVLAYGTGIGGRLQSLGLSATTPGMADGMLVTIGEAARMPGTKPDTPVPDEWGRCCVQWFFGW